MRSTLVVGNWKMNGSLHSVTQLVEGLRAGDVGTSQLVVCPPAIFLLQVGSMLADSDIVLGAQNLCDQASGAFTGEISGAMLAMAGCQYVIVGHSERRRLYAESEQLIAARYAMARQSGLIPILCVGETEQERARGHTEAVVNRQLETAMGNVTLPGSVVIAYEPVWAIGTGQVATAKQAQAVHAFIRAKIAVFNDVDADQIQIIYGGSMNPSNAGDLLSQPDIDGGLIGGASLKATDFLAIAQAA